MRLLVAALILSVVILLGFAAFEARVLVPGPSNGQAKGVVWRGRTFATRAEFARWLRSRGVSYRAWARSHPVEAGLATHGGQKHSGRGAWRLASVAAFLAALALGLTYVRRRWPKSDALAAHSLEVLALRSAAAIQGGARTTRRWAALTAQSSRPLATAAAARARAGTGLSAALLEIVALRSAAAIQAGARTTRRRVALTAQRSAGLSTAATGRARARTGASAAHWLETVALRGAAAAKAGARTTGRWAARTAQRSVALATAPTFSVRRQRSELMWYVTMALLAAGIGVVLTVSLNGG